MQLISTSNILYDLKFVYIALVPVPVFFPTNRVLNKQVNIIEGRLNLSKLPKFYTPLLIFHLLICGNTTVYLSMGSRNTTVHIIIPVFYY